MQIDANYTHKFFTIQSGYRVSTDINPAEFTVELTQPLLDVRQITLEYAQFPNTIVPMQGTSFRFSETVGYAGPTVGFTFPNVFMAPSDLMTYIETQMNTLSPNGYTYTVTIDAVTGIISWTSTGDFTIYTIDDTSGYYLGLTLISDGRLIYPGVPANYTPFGTTFTAPWPINNRIPGLAVRIRPWTADVCSNSDYLDNHLFVIPMGKYNYGEIVEFNHLQQWRQNIAFFDKGHSFKKLYCSIVNWVTSSYDSIPLILNGEFILKFSYSTYRDTLSLSESIDIKA